MHLQNEIAQQPAVIKRLLDEGRDETEAVATAINEFNPAFACIAARGTSDHAALVRSVPIRAYAAAAGYAGDAITAHDLRYAARSFRRTLVIGISQSGKAEDVRAVLADARRQGALTRSDHELR